MAAVDDGGMSTDSEESASMVEEIGAVHHNWKGQYFAKLHFANEGAMVALDCRTTNWTQEPRAM